MDVRELSPTGPGAGEEDDEDALGDRLNCGDASIFTKFLAAEAANWSRSVRFAGDDAGANGTEFDMTGADGTGIAGMIGMGDSAIAEDDDADAANLARVLAARR